MAKVYVLLPEGSVIHGLGSTVKFKDERWIRNESERCRKISCLITRQVGIERLQAQTYTNSDQSKALRCSCRWPSPLVSNCHRRRSWCWRFLCRISLPSCQ